MEDITDDSVIQNLNYFLDKVLYSAQCDGNWTVDSIKQGIGWALYCEKAVQDPSIKCSLNSYLSMYPHCQINSVDDISRLRQLLISNLFHNQLLPDYVIRSLHDISVKELGPDITQILVNDSIFKVKSYDEAVNFLKKEDMKETYNTFKIRLLIEAAANSSIPISALNSLLVMERSLEILLDLSEKLSDTEKSKMIACLGRWISSELNKNNFSLFYHISLLRTSYLEKICETFSGLQTKLLLMMKDFGSKLSLTDNDYSNDDKFKSILSLSRTFLRSPKLRNEVNNAYVLWFKSKETFFWHEIYKLSNINS